MKGTTALAIDARANLDAPDDPDRQVPAGAGHPDRHRGRGPSLGGAPGHITEQLQTQRRRGAGESWHKAPGRPTKSRRLFDRLQPTLPIVLANLVSIGDVAVTYRRLEQLLVLLPQGVADSQATGRANRNTKQAYKGALPELQPQPEPAAAMHHRLPAASSSAPPPTWTAPDRPAGDLYCRIPQDSRCSTSVARATLHARRGRANAPRRSKMCESDEDYVPLNDGYNWKGDPNATLSGQGIPQPPPGSPPRRQRHLRGPRRPDRGRRIRPGHRHLHRTRRPGVHPIESQPRRPKADVAKHADTPEGTVIDDDPRRASPSNGIAELAAVDDEPAGTRAATW